MDEPKFCVLCGVRPVGDGRVKTCSPECWEVFHGLAHMDWPVVLGASIQRACRRAEVAGLVEDVERSLEHSPACEYVMAGDVACDCYLGRASDALSRLARLAGGGA